MPQRLLLGCDFSSSPTRRKPIRLALGRLAPADGLSTLRLDALLHFPTLDGWADWLAAEREPWLGGFDLPFGLPRELVTALGWPTDWQDCMRHYGALSRAEIRARFAAFCAARPPGGKFAHRATDRPAGSSPSMKWVNPPVAWMLHAGVPALLAAQATLPGLHPGRPDRIALEAYPGLLARELLMGGRSYKSDDRAKQTPERRTARIELLAALAQGRTRLGLRVLWHPGQYAELVDDPQGDLLDALLCLVQAAWALREQVLGRSPVAGPGWGLPPCDPLEGWIVTA